MSQHHHLRIVAWTAWLTLLFGAERLSGSIQITPTVHLIAGFGAMMLLGWRTLRNWPPSWTLATAVCVFLVIKCALLGMITFEALPMTLLEAGLIALTLTAAARLGRSMDRFTESETQLLTMIKGGQVVSLNDAEPEMQREIRRARRYGRHLTLVRFRPGESKTPESFQRLIERLSAQLTKYYIVGHFTEFLLRETKANDIISWDGDEFVLLLPETEREQGEAMLARMTMRVEGSLGIPVQSKLAGFPDEEITFTGLLDRTAFGTPLRQTAETVA